MHNITITLLPVIICQILIIAVLIYIFNVHGTRFVLTMNIIILTVIVCLVLTAIIVYNMPVMHLEYLHRIEALEFKAGLMHDLLQATVETRIKEKNKPWVKTVTDFLQKEFTQYVLSKITAVVFTAILNRCFNFWNSGWDPKSTAAGGTNPSLGLELPANAPGGTNPSLGVEVPANAPGGTNPDPIGVAALSLE